MSIGGLVFVLLIANPTAIGGLFRQGALAVKPLIKDSCLLTIFFSDL